MTVPVVDIYSNGKEPSPQWWAAVRAEMEEQPWEPYDFGPSDDPDFHEPPDKEQQPLTTAHDGSWSTIIDGVWDNPWITMHPIEY